MKRSGKDIKMQFLMADVSTYEEGVISAELGADVVATSLAGYTPYTMHSF